MLHAWALSGDLVASFPLEDLDDVRTRDVGDFPWDEIYGKLRRARL